jgi:hypothetical protein
MKRLDLIELEDQAWLPAGVRDAVTDYLQFAFAVFNPYRRILPRLLRVLNQLREDQVVDLCSGSGGPWSSLYQFVQRPIPRTICLTDKFPNARSFEYLQSTSMGVIVFREDPIDATAVPPELCGFRTLFSSFHHFPPAQARAILADAVKRRCGIGVFEVTKRSTATILWMLGTPLFALLFAPFIRPFRWSRLIWTYLVPVVPFLALFDGLVSCFRTYTPAELKALISGLEAPAEYQWEIGEERAGFVLFPIVYLLGYPIMR